MAWYRNILVIAVVSSIIIEPSSSGSILYKNAKGGLTAFPHNIPSDVTEIQIQRSNIPIIDYIEPFSSLTVFIFVDNGLLTFPDFSNVSGSLSRILLSQNNISTVYLPPMPALRTLDLGNNNLVQIPDIHRTTPALTNLYLGYNRIMRIDCIGPFPSLVSLNLDSNPLAVFPELTNVRTTLEELYLVDTPIQKIKRLPLMPRLRFLKIGNCEVEEFPDLTNVSSNLETLYFYRCKIKSIGYLPEMANLKSFFVYRNAIREFPNLVNISSKLVNLDLAYNEIRRVDAMPRMPALQTIKLDGNGIDEFPDLSNAADMLDTVRLYKNRIAYIPYERIIPLLQLKNLDLRQNPLTTLPHFCHLNHTLSIKLQGSNFNCDWRMGFLKIMEKAHNVTYPKETPNCVYPTRLVGRPWSRISIMELINETGDQPEPAPFQQFIFRKIDASTWSCPMAVDTVSTVSKMRCDALCGRTPSCFMFSDLDGLCLLTNSDVGRPETLNRLGNWYFRN
ncbi:hypothetical protein LSH36_852g00030 [Paralvinella palmiformis]|uniref:Uncharacterized protein n=1 Tax=Paralvinella palmiformis TaxID=53620 RepID=A0AAD9IZB8_9ANNE|nr:hypothetical protein LSH36_852g00030 [Paralvinella palmiformis]